MGRKEERGYQSLEVKVPSFFRCPISLDVMKSPVSLCTGVTYDRSSIQKWLESGNNTCPATMQPLPSTDLVPNLTLQRLINIWGAAATAPHAKPHPARALLLEIRSSADQLTPLRKLSAFLSDDDADDFDKNRLINAAEFASTLSSVINGRSVKLEALEEAIGVAAKVLAADFIEEANRKSLISSLSSDLSNSVSSIVRVLKEGNSFGSRINSAAILDAVISNSDADSKLLISEKPDLISELIRLAGGVDEKLNRSAIETGLSCLLGISSVRRARIQMVRLRMVPVLTRILREDAAIVPASAAEKAMRLLEVASGCADGREAICQDAESCIGAILGRMMKVGRGGTEAAVVVLWSVCHLFRDRRAQEAAAAANGGLTKILLLMQSNCSPAVRQMSADLLKIFRVNSKSCLSGYDTKTTHIMPF